MMYGADSFGPQSLPKEGGVLLLRGPLARPPPQQDRNTLRLRVALYAATATTWLLHITASWTWTDATVIHSAAMWVVVLLFMRVLGGDRPYTRGAGVLGYGGFTVIGVLDLVGWPAPPTTLPRRATNRPPRPRWEHDRRC